MQFFSTSYYHKSQYARLIPKVLVEISNKTVRKYRFHCFRNRLG